MDLSAPNDIEVESSSHGQVVPQPEPEPVDPSPQGDGDPGDEQVETKPDPASEAGKVLGNKRSSLQAKINDQTAKQRTAERERDTERQRADAAERELQTLKQPKSTENPEPPRYTRPKPTEDEIGTKYETYGAYVEDLTDWKVEQRDVQQAETSHHREVQRRHEQHAQTFSERISKAEETDPAFWSKMSPAIVDMRPSGSIDPRELRAAQVAANQGNRNAIAFLCRTAIADVIFTSDLSTELMTHFSANDRDLQRLSTLPPNELYRELGRIEALYSRPAAASAGPAVKTLPVSQAAPPIKPVGSTASIGDRDPLSDDLDIDEHIKVMNAKERKAGHR